MKRALVFLVAAPASVGLIAWLVVASAGGGAFAGIVAAMLSFFTLVVSALAGTIDGWLARSLPMPLRALLTAIVGATAACSLAFVFSGCVVPPFMLIASGGAICMAVCSLLSNDYGSSQQLAVSMRA